MQSTFITSHGRHCIGGKGANTFKLPTNVIVLMNCDNSIVWTDEYFESRFWSFATDSKLHLSMTKDKLSINAFGKFLAALEKFNGVVRSDTNNFCVFADKCPDLLFSYEADEFRSGIFKLPATVIVKNKKTKGVGTKLTSAMFSKFAEKDASLPRETKRMIGAWVQINDRGDLHPYEYFSVKNRKPFPSENYVDNMLSKMIKDIAEEQPNKMHFIVVSACRDSQKVDLKLQQYSVTQNPYQTAIVVYDKVRKYLENKQK
jgi:hypothetical protein